jgi:hypothetical protein
LHNSGPAGKVGNVGKVFGANVTGPWGTGFLIARESPTLPGELHYYGVTNWHVACRGASIIRLNTNHGRSRLIELDPAEWHFIKGHDVAAVDLSEQLNPTLDQIKHNNEERFVTADAIDKLGIGPGEDAFMCGLFVSHGSTERNVPAMRFGNLGMLASDDAPVELETGASLPCHLVDMRSRTGFSGSPVFIYRTLGSDLSKWGKDGLILDMMDPTFVALLGIHCGQFWDTIEFKKPGKRSEKRGDPILEGDKIRIQGSMTIVLPAWRISELLDLEVFELARRKRDEQREERWEKRPRAESADDASDSDENPRHLEDFKRLVDLAAKK